MRRMEIVASIDYSPRPCRRVRRVRSAEQIAEQIEGIGGMLSVESGFNTIRIAASSLSDDFSDAFAVMMDVAVNPVFPDRIDGTRAGKSDRRHPGGEGPTTDRRAEFVESRDLR